jgi:hypothetical protein
VNKIIKTVGLVLGFAVAIALAQAPVRLVDGTAKGIVLGAPGTPYNSGMVTGVTTGTTITAATTKVKVMFCRNNSASDITFTITDSGGTVYFPTNTSTAKQAFMLVASDIGLTMTGIVITPSANSALACQVEGAQ